MLVVDLHCTQGHHFEGWFGSADDLSSQQAKGLVSCPVCGDKEVVRRPSAPRLNVSHLKQEASQPSVREDQRDSAQAVNVSAAPPPSPEALAKIEALQAAYMQAVKHVLTHTEDVGDQFAAEARSIHHGDAPERAIRGQASLEEREALKEEGIDVVSLPIPQHLKGNVQ